VSHEGEGSARVSRSFAVVKSLVEFDNLTVQEIFEAFDQEREDLLLNPWRRGYGAAVRAAMDH
jgi:hypothetical protein